MTLASAVGEATRALRLAETKIEVLLNMLLGERGWAGWQFFAGQDNRYGVDVFGVADSRELARNLFSVGFTSVTLHDHSARQWLTCVCRTYEAY